MKKEYHLPLLPLVCCLTACGSGSSVGVYEPPVFTKEDTVQEYFVRRKTRENMPIVVDVLTSDRQYKTKDINVLHIDGKEIQLLPSLVLSGGFTTFNDSKTYRKVSGNNYKYMRLGFYGEKDTDGSFKLSKSFVQGAATSIDEFPKTNKTFTYRGNAIFSDKGMADVELTVNFADKSVTGIIDNLTGFEDSALGKPPASKYEFKATMMWGAVGASVKPQRYFTGTEMKKDGEIVGTGIPERGQRANTRVSGSFFGPNAEEAGGHWSGVDNFVFGAKR